MANSALPAPHTNAAAATHGADACSAIGMSGIVTQGQSDEADELVLGPDAPVLHIRGIAYKGTVETSTRPPDRAA